MNTLSQAENKQLVVDHRFSWLRQLGWISFLTGSAAFLGWNVARERWLLLLAMALIPLLALWPIPLAFGGYALLVPFDTVGVSGEKGGPALTFFAGVLAGAVLLGTGYLRGRLQRPPSAALWWFLFVAWGGLSSLWAIDQNRVIGFLPTALGALFLYLAASSVRITREEFSWVVLATILGGCAAAAYSSSQYYSGVFYHASVTGGRSSLIIGERETDPNIFAASLFLPLSLAVGRFLETRGWQRVVYLAMVGLISVAVLLTMSRGALFGLAVMIFIYFRRLGFDRRVLIPVAILLLSLVAAPDRFLGRLQSAEATGGAGRLYIWEVGLAALKHYGLFGAGMQNFSEAYTNYVGESSKVYSYGEVGAHNIYLEVAVDLGLVGLGLMGTAIFSAMRAGRRIREQLNQRLANSIVPYEAAAWAMLTSSFFVSLLWRKTFWLVWILYAIVVRLAQGQSDQSATGVAPKVVRARQSVLL